MFSLFPHTSLPVVLVGGGGGFSPREHSALSAGLGCPPWGREGAATGLSGVEARDAPKHRVAHRQPCSEELPCPKRQEHRG